MTILSSGNAGSLNYIGFKLYSIHLVGSTGSTLALSIVCLPEAMKSLECIHRLLSKTEKGSQRWGKTLKPSFRGHKPRGVGSLTLFCMDNTQEYERQSYSLPLADSWVP